MASASSSYGFLSAGQSQSQSRSYDEGISNASDSESSLSPSPNARGRCFCGQHTERGGIYCSVACARSDAFSSLCYKPAPSPHTSLHLADEQPTVASISAALSRANSSASSTASTASSHLDSTDWNASHYRRLARAELRREERREDRKRRRAEGSSASTMSRSTIMSTSSSASRAVPELVGGFGASHSRNPSIASSVTSLSSSSWGAGSNLSRNGSSASTSSRRGYGNNINVDAAIIEADDEEEWLQSEISHPYVPVMPVGTIPTHRRQDNRSHGLLPSSGKKGKKADPLPFGMGKDMRDVLEEIIQMEKSFLVSDNEADVDDDANMMPAAAPGLFTNQFDRPPRTPSPITAGRRRGQQAPGAPMRGHRSAVSQPNIHACPTYHPAPAPALPPPAPGPPPQRPPSLMGLHQSSLSESHTALYLATASPAATQRRCSSPKLEMRRSLSFTPDAAGPSISLDSLPLPRYNFDPSWSSHLSSPGMVGNTTPMGRRRNITPSAKHPAMDNWRFPSPANRGSASTMATPTKPPSQVSAYPHGHLPSDLHSAEEKIEPALLWPAPPPNLQPSLFPCSPATDTPIYVASSSMSARLPRSDSSGMLNDTEPDMSMVNGRLSAPGSGLRLGVLLGSGNDDGGMEVDQYDDDEGDGSTEQGHGSISHQRTRSRGMDMGFLPVFLEAEGFRSSNGGRAAW